jgi:hypothetical protein
MPVFYFDPNSVSDFVSLKEGENSGKISYVSMENASTGGQFLLVSVDFGGLEIKARFNVVHSNKAAVDIALSELRSVYLAAGINKPANAQALLGKRVQVVLEKELNEQTGKSYFKIVKWLHSGSPVQPQRPPQRDEHPYSPAGEVPF